jgi:hypothetical protein
VVDAVDLFKRINEFTSTKSKTQKPTALHTYAYPYTNNASYYLKPGAILFWKYKKNTFPYGHVALVLDSNPHETVIIQQNLNPPVKTYNTKELFEKMNCASSKFAGVKLLPPNITENISTEVKYTVVRL